MPQEGITDTLNVHTSDTATFKRCRRRWNWTSPQRHNLRPKVSYAGMSFPLTFGTCIHTALEEYYKSDADPADVFLEEWLHTLDKVHQLNEGWYIENGDEIAEHQDLGIGMMNYYKEWAPAHDNFEVISTEHLFSVDTGLTARNERTKREYPVHYRGRMDMVVRDKDTGRYGILDHKTSSSGNTEDYLAKLDMDEQVTRYVWAAEQEAKASNGLLPYTKIDFVYYNVLFKGYPKPPTFTSKGVPSLNRAAEFTTHELFAKSILGNPELETWYKTTPKAQEYAEYLREQSPSRFIHREVVYRNPQEIQSAGERILMEIQDMLAPDLRIYPNPTGDWYCLKCPFRSPCLAAMDGSDVDYMLDIAYEPNMDKEGSYTNV